MVVSFLAFNLIENVVSIGPSRELREVRDADDLPAPRELSDTSADRRGGSAADAGIDLVENQCAPCVARAGQHDDE